MLYFDGCPHWRSLAARLEPLASELGVTVEHVLVETEVDAGRWGFHGSPSVLVDGVDPFASSDAAVGLTCRVYTTPEGLAGSPTVDQLRAALGARPIP